MTELIPFEQNTVMQKRGIDEPTYLTLKNSIFTGASDESIAMVIDYCTARGLDPLMKPVHIVPMSVKIGNEYVMKDVIMAGINTYRIQADRSGTLAGVSSPVFGPEITAPLGNVTFTYPEWCEVTVSKFVSGNIVDFTAREYFTENYATKGRNYPEPNSMWAKRPKGQLAKCAEAQALRKGFPEVGQMPTYEEMAGKTQEKDITPQSQKPNLLEAGAQDTPKFDTNQLMAEMNDCQDLEELKELFKKAQKHLKNNSPELTLVCQVKDEHKLRIIQENS